MLKNLYPGYKNSSYKSVRKGQFCTDMSKEYEIAISYTNEILSEIIPTIKIIYSRFPLYISSTIDKT